MEDLNHHITKSIRTFYRKKILSPIVMLALLIVLALFFPVTSFLFPKQLSMKDDPADAYKKSRFVTVTISDAWFTGYRKIWLGHTVGYYYYTMMGDDCVMVLVSPEDCQQGISELSSVHFRAEIVTNSLSEQEVIRLLSNDLSWASAGTSGLISTYLISEPDAADPLLMLFAVCYVFCFLYTLADLIICLISIYFPILSKPVQSLAVYGNPAKILAEAEKELATLPQLATEDMFITEHYFIETSAYGVAIVPINRIIWIYKYSTLHKFLWHHFSISYTLYITADKRQYIKCPKNMKSDIDGIMDYLAEANHNILVGFSEENRRKVAQIQDDFAPLERLLRFLSRKV